MSRITNLLANATSRSDANEGLATASKAELTEAARALDVRSDGNKTQIAARLVESTVGSRENHAAIRNTNLR